MAGIFDLPCPACGQQVRGMDSEYWVCVRCEVTYLLGVGHLVPVRRSPSVRSGQGADDLSSAGS